MIKLIIPILTTLASIVYLHHLYRLRGLNDVKLFVAISTSIVVPLESLGVYSGRYKYIWHNYLINSYFVATGWIMNIYPMMHISLFILIGKRYFKANDISRGKKLQASILTGIFAVLYDLFLDPVAVSLGIWVWSVEGQWFGVPIRNFVGWFFIASTVTLIYLLLAYAKK